MSKPHAQAGYVYVLHCDDFIKIGRVSGNVDVASKGLIARIGSIQTSNPHRVTLLGYVWVSDAKVWERVLHRQFKDRKHSGEWFKFEPEDYDALHTALEARSTENVDERSVESLIDAKLWSVLRLKFWDSPDNHSPYKAFSP